MKFITIASLLSGLVLSGCGSTYATWTPRESDISESSPVDCQRGIGICPGRYGRAAQMRRDS